MSAKKIGMIVLLIIFVGIIGFLLFNVNNKSVEKADAVSKTDSSNDVNEISNDEKNKESENSNEFKTDGKVRKSTGKAKADMDNIIEIKDKLFIEQTNDFFLNLNEYVGKTVKIEGLIYNYKDDKDNIYYAVVRNTPGCCGNDGLAGLDIRYDEDYPKDNTWVEVIGVVQKDKMSDGSEIPAIQISSIKEKEKGKTFVKN